MVRLAMGACLPLILAAASNCPKPTDVDLCYPSQGQSCDNDCIKITGDGTTKHRDCLGNTSAKNCEQDDEGGTAGGTKWVYNIIAYDGKCSSCGSTILDGPDAVSANCRTATTLTDDCGS